MAKKKAALMKEEVIEEEQVPETEAEEIPESDELEEVEDFHESEDEEAEHNGSEEIFPFGPTYDMVSDWKARYDGEIYMSDFADQIFIWRPIRRKEYREIQRVEGSVDEYYMEESICRTCVLYPEDYAMHKITFGKAGIPSTLSQMIMERSGFLRPATVKL